MARPRNEIPNLKYDAKRNRYYVLVNRKRVWLGPDRIEAERQRLNMASGAPLAPTPGKLTLAEALEVYQRHERSKRRDCNRINAAILAACAVCGAMPADQFRAKALRSVRESLVARGTLCRRYINHLTQALKTAVGWLVSEELLPADCLASVRSVRALGPGAAPDRQPVGPVDPETVARTLPHLSPTIAAMVKIQQLTGMRPVELCRMRRCDVSTSPEQRLDCGGRTVAAMPIDGAMVWLYVPTRHKNTHRGKPRVIGIGPEAQAVLAPILMAAEPTAYLFRPRGSVAHYTAQDYGRAIRRAIARHGLEPWHVYSLRHSFATVVAEKLDAESASLLLGHSAGSRIINTYVDDSIKRVAEASRKIG